MNAARIAAIGVAAVLAAAGAWAFLRQDPPPRPAASVGTPPPAEGTWDPNGAPSAGPKRAAPSAGSPAEPLPQALPSSLPDVGTPVKAGQDVAVVVPWGAGSPSTFRYEIVDLSLVRYEATEYVDALQTTWRVVLTTVDGDGKGAARVRLVVESLEIRGFGPAGIPYREDSRTFDPERTDQGILRVVVPAFSIVGQPLEFRVSAQGSVTDVEGAENWRERYLTEVQRLEKRAVNDAPDAWTRDSVVQTWGEFFFPRIGGGTLAGGASRPWTQSRHVGGGWDLVWSGKLEATRDDPDAFRAEFVGSPRAEQVGGTPTGEADATLAKVYAHGGDRSYLAAYRFGRSPGALVEAQIDQDYRFVTSRKTAGAPGAPSYTPEWTQRKRRAIVRRTGN